MQRRTKPLNKTRRKCPSRKIRFDNQYDAERSLNHHDDPNKPVHPVRAYYHDECHGWHLSSSAHRDPLVYACCGGTVGARHELSCELVTPEEFFARTGGRVPRQSQGGTA